MKKVIETKNAPAPIGPYSQAILINQTLYTSGQIAINVKNGELVTSNIIDETKQVMQNLKEVLKAAEMNFEDVVKSTIYITNMGDFVEINKVYGSYFNERSAPARETVQVAKLPKNVHVEISVVAIR
jgi:2-iminobutanoate/2-iminopropanoate deaminase